MMQQQNHGIQAVLADFALPALRVVADQNDIAALEAHPQCRIAFPDALRQALAAFLRNSSGSPDQGHDSAVDVVRSAPEDFGLGAQPTDAEIEQALHGILANDPKAEIVLLTPTTIAEDRYRFTPEFGEPIDNNWVFRIIAPASWPFLQWSIVDLTGAKPAYSYEFD